MSITQPHPEIIATIKKANRVVVATHVFPDGDALGSQLALGRILESLGKEVRLYGEEPVSYLYDFLPGCNKLQESLEDLDDFDCLIALDCGDCLRLGRKVDEMLAFHPVVVIDHHDGHKEFGDQRWVDPTRASTGEMVLQLAKALEAEIDYEAAYCLYTAIVSDTGSFKYSSTSEQTFLAAAELIAKGVKPEEVAGKLFDNFTPGRLELLQMVLATLELHADGQVALIDVRGAMFAQTGTTAKDTETFINFPRSIASVKVAIFIKETDDGVVGVSMRSKGVSFDVAAVARDFGGGGHRNAAGFKKKNGTAFETVRQELLNAVLEKIGQ